MKISDSAKNGATLLKNIGCDNFDLVSKEIQSRIDESLDEYQEKVQNKIKELEDENLRLRKNVILAGFCPDCGLQDLKWTKTLVTCRNCDTELMDIIQE